MIRAVIFDLDGTVANTISALQEGINLTMKEYGYPEHTEEEVLTFVNRGARELVRSAMPENDRHNEAKVDAVLASYEKNYETVYFHTDRPYDGIPEAVTKLHKDYRIAVLSNKQDSFVRRLCKILLPKGSYDAAQGVVPGHPTKPDPYLPARVAKTLGVKLCECVMIGDSDVDIATARNAGMQHIGVSWGYRSEEFLLSHGAAKIAHTPAEILTILNQIKN